MMMQEKDTNSIMSEQLSTIFFRCKSVGIQNMQRNQISASMMTHFLRNNGLTSQFTKLQVSPKNGFARIQFIGQKQAEDFYYEHNFKSKILNRPLNIFFNMPLQKQMMKRLYIHGITNTNQRQIFDILEKYGPVKIYSVYASLCKQDVKPSAMVSFIRSEPFTQNQLLSLKKSLREIEVKIQPYNQKSTCSIKLFNFASGNFGENLSQEEQFELNDFISDQYKDIFITDPKRVSFHIDRGRVQAIIDFEDQNQTIRNFERLRDQLVLKDNQEKATLFMHAEQYKSYRVLFTKNLKKPQQDISDKKFEKILLYSFRRVNQAIVHISVLPTKTIGYIGKVYFRNQQDGKNFMIEYTQRRKQIVRFFMDKNQVTFNFNLDNQQLRKTRNTQVRASQIMHNFTQQNEEQKRIQAFRKKIASQNQNSYTNSRYYRLKRDQSQLQTKPVNKKCYKPRQEQKKEQSFPQLFSKPEISEQSQKQESFPEISSQLTFNDTIISKSSSTQQTQFRTYTFDRTLFEQKKDFIQWLQKLGMKQSEDFKQVKFRTNVKAKRIFGQVQLSGKAFKICNKKQFGFYQIEFKIQS